MKFLLVAFLIGVCYAAPKIDNNEKQLLNNKTTIEEDIHDLMEIIPVEKIKRIAIEHLHNDLEFQAAVQYMKGPEWNKMMNDLFAEPAAQNLYKFLKDAGLNLDEIEKLVCGFMKDINVSTNHTVRSFKNFVQDVRKVIPMMSVIEMFDTKLRTSEAFNEFYAKISGKECYELIQEVRKLDTYKVVIKELKAMDVDIEAMLRIMYGIFNWEMIPLEKM